MRWLALLFVTTIGSAWAEPVVVSAGPASVAVSLYHDADRRPETAIDLADPKGFAVVSEVRRVTLPPGPVVIRFEGVASGIQPQTAIVVGPPTAETNRDARLLSQRGLLDAFTGQAMTLRRTDRATGRTTTEQAILRSDAERLVIQTARGIEAVKCSGLAQTLLAPRVPAGLSAKPVLSVLTRDQPGGTVEVTLTYLASRFDWQANYVAELSRDARHVDLLGWLTMASADDTSFVDAAASAIAGRVSKAESDDDDAEEGDLRFSCWPAGRTTDGLRPPPLPPSPRVAQDGNGCGPDCSEMSDIIVTGTVRRQAFTAAAIAVTATQENVGDLKLFRIPVPVTVAARSQKQVAFTAKRRVPGELVQRVIVTGTSASDAKRVYRLRNTHAGGLGQALPTGQWTLCQQGPTGRALVGQATLPDKTEGEDIDLVLGGSTVTAEVEERGHDRDRLTLRNPTDEAVTVRLEFALQGYRYEGLRIAERKPGRAIMLVRVRANATKRISYRAVDPDD